ncbi:MAG: helix-turn-helix domain-containing protein [Pelagimonas sp.]|jgi:AraC family carnitine catabolism transcriptional activator|nr:helix-turn-helix domain-containing protein [Pelagimonas sp.]
MHVCLILFPGFPLLAYVLLREVLETANACARRDLFSLEVRKVTDRANTAVDGTTVPCATIDWDGAQGFDLVLLCAGAAPLDHLPMGLRGFLARAENAGGTLGGLGSAGLILAKLGLLKGREAVLDPTSISDAPEWLENIAVTERPFAFDRQRLTASGGIAVVEALLAWIGRVHSLDLAAQTGDAMAFGRVKQTSQDLNLSHRADPLLDQMQSIMTTQLETPLPLGRIASELGISQKQLRTRCRNAMGQTPAQIYLHLRLERAEHLLRDTARPIQEIASATGFSSPSSFSRSFKAQFGQSPRALRRPQAQRHETTWGAQTDASSGDQINSAA